MSEPFYKSEVVRQELHDMQRLYKDLYDISIRFPLMEKEEKKDHLEKTMQLIAKQKVFYARLSLMSLEDSEAADLKIRIDQMTSLYSGGQHINDVLETMEKRLKSWKKELDSAK
tara:strand:+ start:1897 stop:2238 length:342 start_codon:yes stop_codon:yes gene_type:complete